MERGLTSHFDKKKTHNKTGSNCSEKWDQNGFKFYREIGQKWTRRNKDKFTTDWLSTILILEMVLLPEKKRGKDLRFFGVKKIDFISGAHQVIRKISNNIPLFLVESVTLGFYAKSVEALYIFFKTASNIWCSCGEFSLFSWLVTFCCKCAQRVCLSTLEFGNIFVEEFAKHYWSSIFEGREIMLYAVGNFHYFLCCKYHIAGVIFILCILREDSFEFSNITQGGT